jgi:hypothetical protein
MYNAKYIIPGIIIFLAACLFPFWDNYGTQAYVRPELVLPEGEEECIEPVEYMRTDHMRLLNEWRDKALREGLRSYTATDGRKWTISLQNTCMSCHNDKVGFCDACHNEHNVVLSCWDCHVEPKEGQ